VLARGTRRVINRAATALRMAAVTLMRSRTYSERNTTVAHQARCPESHYRDGPPAPADWLSNAEVRSAIH